MPLPFVHGPQWISAPGSVGFASQGGGCSVGYLACHPNWYVSSIPTTSLNLPLRMASKFRLCVIMIKVRILELRR